MADQECHGRLWWKVSSASAAGRSHRVQGRDCEDAVFSVRGSGFVATCVCDGAGSAAFGGRGARVVARAVAKSLADDRRRFFDRRLGQDEVLKEARAAIRKEMSRNGGEHEDYACTLLAAVVQGRRAVTFHVGDGVISLLGSKGAEAISLPQNGDHPNETTFVTCSRAKRLMKSVHLVLPDSCLGLALMTDGAQWSLYCEKTKNMAPAVGHMGSWLDQCNEVATSQALTRVIEERLVPRTDDDCTIAIVRRHRGPFFCLRCRDDGLVARHENRSVRIECTGCKKTLTQMQRVASQAKLGSWVRYLANVRGKALDEIARCTGLKGPSLQRLLADRTIKTTGDRTEPMPSGSAA